ncbi:hypothetical protein [Yoonia sp. R2-816]
MPKRIKRPIGTIYETKEVKTFGDRVKDVLEGIAGCGVIIGIIYLLANAG